MNQKGAAVLLLMLVFGLIGSVIVYDVVKNDRLNLNPVNPNNWEWNNDWNNSNPPVQPGVPGVPQQPQHPQQPQRPQPPMNQINADSYDDAIKKSGEYGMPVLVFFSTESCHWCTKMKNETLTQGEVKSMMMNYIVVYVDASRNRSVARKFGVRGVPAYSITNAREQNLKSDAGFKNASAFASWLNNPNLFNQQRVQPQQPQQNQPRPRRQG